MSRHPSRRLERVVTPHLFATVAGLLGTIGTVVSQSQLGATPGFSSRRIWEATAGASAIRGFALVPDALGPGRDSLFVGIVDRVERYDQFAQPPVATYMLPGNGTLETIDWLPPTQPGSNGTIVFTRFLPSTLFAIEVDAFGGPTPPTMQPMPNNTFDIASSRDGRRLVATANPNWPSPGATAGVWLVDPTGTNGVREIITIDGPSGPLGFLANGDLAYTVQSRTAPPPPGSIELVRFPVAVLDLASAPGAAPATLNDALPLQAGLDAVYAVTGGSNGETFVTDPANKTLDRFFAGPRPAQPLASASDRAFPLHLQWIEAEDSEKLFEVYQPPSTSRLLVMTSDFGTFAAVHDIRPARPTTLIEPSPSFGPSNATWIADGLPPNAPVSFFLSPAPPAPEEFIAATYGGLPMWLSTSPQIAAPASFSSNTGTATLTVRVPVVVSPIVLGLFAVSTTTSPAGTPAPVTSLATPFDIR